MFRHVGLGLGLLTRCLPSHRSLLLENLALRQQLTVLQRKHPRPRMGAVDKIFWVVARRFWGAWKHSLVLVNPDTVVRWHRAGFRLYWSWISKARLGFIFSDHRRANSANVIWCVGRQTLGCEVLFSAEDRLFVYPFYGAISQDDVLPPTTPPFTADVLY